MIDLFKVIIPADCCGAFFDFRDVRSIGRAPNRAILKTTMQMGVIVRDDATNQLAFVRHQALYERL